MILTMRSAKDAPRVAELTGGTVVPNDKGRATRQVRIEDFAAHQQEVESVSVLFSLARDDGDPLPSPWVCLGARFEVEWPKDPEVVQRIRSHFGARRYAKNWALAKVGGELERRKVDPTAQLTPWTLQALRKAWNEGKHGIAPWWRENSKESYASGITDAVVALQNFASSRNGTRKGRQVGFPRFESRRRAKNRLRFTTGAMRLEPDRRGITLPRIGTLPSKENTRRVQRHVAKGSARVLSITLSEHCGRLCVSITYAVRRKIASPSNQGATYPDRVVGVDLGLRHLATCVDSAGEVLVLENPRVLKKTLAARRRAARQLSRRIPGSRGYERAKAKLARMDRRIGNIRRDLWHKFTRVLVDTYAEIHIEDLDVAAMGRGMGRRAFRRSVLDAALGMFRRRLEYKAEWAGRPLVVVDRFFASSMTHYGCGGRFAASRPALSKHLVCERCGETVDRDINAAKNLRDWPETHASPGAVGASAPRVPGPLCGTGGGSAASHDTELLRRSCKTPLVGAVTGEARTEVALVAMEEPREGCV